MTFAEFVALIAEMRAAQKEYHNPKTRTENSIGKAITLERRVDLAIKEVSSATRSQGTLFDRKPDEGTP